ncbi:MAG: Cell division protein FtsZ [Candidatus Nomurabacteria bacterium GW2011_GWA1_35_8]|uniref:Cell division protein FtsZ n=1 Tax=Candidatus Nomurabacteria bacterium GW2011_GWA1_35_8 TaxID=1618727 RepID=A0A0G0CXV4_9BACT|nr:MAG: Cell division protein FtsZ [Candidatus Nomurabacteria bacterium GW2011_GWA1_35_8]
MEKKIKNNNVKLKKKTKATARRFKKSVKLIDKKNKIKKAKKIISNKTKKNKVSNKLKEYNLAKIKVVGVGGAGCNAITRMSDNFIKGVDLIAVNTDIQDLNYCVAKKKVYIGKNLTKGLGTGMDPEIGKLAAEESRTEIIEAIKDADLLFLTAGFGGGTGTGAFPVIAELAKEMGILTVAVITKPFVFEGFERIRIADEGVSRIKDRVDTLIIIPNDRIFSVINKNTSLIKAFEAIDEVLKNSVFSVAELIASPGIINIDFADVKSIIQNAGMAIIGFGISSGGDRAITSVNAAINSPLLEASINGAKRIIFSVSGHRDLKMNEIHEIARLISEQSHHSSRIIFGAHYDRKLKKGELKVTLIATGFNGDFKREVNVLPNLFLSDTNRFSDNAREERAGKAGKNIDKQIIEQKEASIQKEEIWDIPTFLRKKRR